MTILVICCSLLMFFLISILFSPIGKKIDTKRKRLNLVVNKKKEFYNELDLSIYNRFIAPNINKISDFISSISKKLKKANSNKNTNTELLENELRHAGLRLTAEEFSVIKLIFICVVFFLTLLICFILKIDIALKLLVFIMGIILAILAPRLFLKSKITSRQELIKQQLPEVMDLLCVSMEAGLSFDSALLKISEKMDGSLIDELLILYREIQMGRPRREALKDFGDCSSISELKTFASAVIQADQLGIAIKNVLALQAKQLRTARRQAAQEKGMKSPIKMMLPMVAFIFPVVFIILLGPTIIQVMNQFSK